VSISVCRSVEECVEERRGVLSRIAEDCAQFVGVSSSGCRRVEECG